MTNSADESSRRSGATGQPERAQATVVASLPNGMFRLRMADGREVVAHAAQDLRVAFVRLCAGDVVVVEVSPFDPDKARIRSLRKSDRISQPSVHRSQPNQREQS
ncbi:MAG: translation initiation factor IF-1 [Planctomycetes bacterium]|nr:translation initiation factor IF-1 [Planctomycetota bacterium]